MSVWLTPRMVGAHLLAIICVGIAAGFGVWQYDAWQVRRAAEQVDLTHAEPVAIDDVIGPDDPFPGDRVGQPVRVSGTWVPEGTVLIAGRETGTGDVGRWVVTPITSGGPDDPALPVVRGWLAEEAATPEPPRGEAELVGWLQPPEAARGPDEDPSDDVLPHLRVADIVQRVPGDLYAAYIVLDNESTADGGETNTGTAGLSEATLDQLPPVGTFTALRNLLYSLEWFVFAGFALFIWWRYVRDEVAGERDRSDAAADAVAQPAED